MSLTPPGTRLLRTAGLYAQRLLLGAFLGALLGVCAGINDAHESGVAISDYADFRAIVEVSVIAGAIIAALLWRFRDLRSRNKQANMWAWSGATAVATTLIVLPQAIRERSWWMAPVFGILGAGAGLGIAIYIRIALGDRLNEP